MASVIFPHAFGTVQQIRLTNRRRAAFSIDMDGWAVSTKAIITRVGVVQNGNFQLLHTLGDKIFIYIFGERVSEIQVSGVAFGTYGEESKTGIPSVFQYYDANKLTKRKTPVLIRFGPEVVFRTFLTGADFEISDPALGLGQFTFRFRGLPTSATQK